MSNRELFRIDDSRMPAGLGSALRVPSYAYQNWGISGDYRIESDACYTAEWREGSPQQMKYVIDAVLAAGFKNNSQILRDSCARVVAHRVGCLAQTPAAGRINVMDVGAGVSTINMFDAIDSRYKDRVFFTLVEPSEKRAETAASELDKRGLARDKDYKVVVAPDQHLLAFVNPGTQDIVTYVAVLHHHAYIDTPAKHAHVTMKNGGLLVISDWHNPEWEHPGRVYEALAEDYDPDEFGWETKHRDLLAFATAYPKALEAAPALSPLDQASYMEIRGFWRGWSRVRKAAVDSGAFDPRDDILMLEAHRPVERQNEVLARAGFNMHPEYEAELIGDGILEANPGQLLETSRLLMTTVAEK
jgi:SAM-dependent methyltransferase